MAGPSISEPLRMLRLRNLGLLPLALVLLLACKTKTSEEADLNLQTKLLTLNQETGAYGIVPPSLATVSLRVPSETAAKSKAANFLSCNACDTLNSGRTVLLTGSVHAQDIANYPYEFTWGKLSFLAMLRERADNVEFAQVALNLEAKPSYFRTKEPFEWETIFHKFEDQRLRVVALRCVSRIAVVEAEVSAELYPVDSTEFPFKNPLTNRRPSKSSIRTDRKPATISTRHWMLILPFSPASLDRSYSEKSFDDRCGAGTFQETVGILKEAAEKLPNARNNSVLDTLLSE